MRCLINSSKKGSAVVFLLAGLLVAVLVLLGIGFGTGVIKVGGYTKKDFDRKVAAIEAFRQDLLEKERYLLEKEKGLKDIESRYELQKAELDKKRQEIDALALQIEQKIQAFKAEMEQKKQEEDANIAELAKLYAAMPIESVVNVFERMDISLATRIITKMNKKQAGKLMGALLPDLALKISEKIKEGAK